MYTVIESRSFAQNDCTNSSLEFHICVELCTNSGYDFSGTMQISYYVTMFI